MLEKYIQALKTGTVNGYGYIDTLSAGQIEILCRIASSVSEKAIQTAFDLKTFTVNADRKTFDRYVENMLLAYDDLKEC